MKHPSLPGQSRILLLALSFLFPLTASWAQVIESPGITGTTSFAVVIDSLSLAHCRPQVAAYKATLEAEGLPTYVVSATWTQPEQVKDVLYRLYREHRLEGTVFMGDIPIVMVTKAQFLTSAFKMDERQFPLEQVAVPSDRFYDDFDLTFLPLDVAPQGLKHFYQLAPQSLPYIACDIYSARIRPQKANGDPFRQLAAYLEKAVAAHRKTNPFDSFVSYTGHGSYSNSLTAWESEAHLVQEQFGDTFQQTDNARFLRYSMADYMKPNVIKELRRPELDFMVFHEHGDSFRMYLSAEPEERDPDAYLQATLRTTARRDWEQARENAAAWGLDSTWFCDANTPEVLRLDSLSDLRQGIILEEVNTIAPNARLVLFDACYNGDFREDDFMAGAFIMAPGACVAGYANSVNVLQDKSAFDLLGLLKGGARLGLWTQHIHLLESHLIGDPTFHFTAPDAAQELNAALVSRDTTYWRSRLDDPVPDIRNVALIQLFEGGVSDLSDLLYQTFCHSPYAVVRYQAMTLLERLNDTHYHQVLKQAVYDPFEFIRRVAVTRMGMCGHEDFLPYLVEAYVNDRTAARVVFNVTNSLCCFDKERTVDAIETFFKSHTYFNAAQDKQALLDLVNDDPGTAALQTILDQKASPNFRRVFIQFLRNRPYHQHSTALLELMADPNQDALVRTLLAESFAWYRLSCKKDEILRTSHRLLDTATCPPDMEQALIALCTRLESEK